MQPTANARRVSYQLRREWDIDAHLSYPRFGRFESLGFSTAPTALQSLVGISTSRSVRLVLDGSGFAYGDRWSGQSIGMIADLAQRWNANRIPFVLLPQAFGPFERREVADATKRLMDNADLIFARDRVSYEHITDLIGLGDRVQMAPDISISLDVPKPDAISETVYIVPNINLTGAGRKHLDSYASSLVHIYSSLHQEGHRPQVLVHSTLGDPEVVKALLAIDPSLEVCVPRNGWEAKLLISRARGLVGGRFHALVSALSTGVPVTAHSWSHKYGELLASFGSVTVLSDPFDPYETVTNLQASISDPRFALTTSTAKQRMIEELETMWNSIRSRLH